MKKILMLICSAMLWFVACAQVCYKVSGNGLAEPSYLFGTHHLSPLKIYTDNDKAKEAFEASKQVVGEIDMTVNQMEMAMKMQPYMIAPADSTLSKVLTADEYAAAKKFFEEYSPQPGLTLEMMDLLKPSAVMQTLAVSLIMKNMPEYNPAEQLDTYFQVQGKKDGKKILGLETVEFQADMLYNMHSIRKQAEQLMEMVNDPQKSIDEANELNKAYFAQDMQKMYEFSIECESDPVFFEKLLLNRNADWITKLPAIMSEGSSFIAVGCLHLVGEYGLIKMLRDKGYVVEAIGYSQN